MARSSSALSLTSFFLIICLAITGTAPHAKAAIPCSRVLSSLSSCIGYAQRGGPVPGGCCDGLKSLNNAAKTTPDLQSVCNCLKTLAPGLGARPDLINSLPGKCGVNIPYKYSPSIDCSKVVR